MVRGLVGAQAPETKKDGEGAVTLAELSVSPNLSRDTVRRMVEGRLRELAPCLGPGVPGKLVAAVTVGTNGTVTDVQVLSGAPRREHLRKCIQAVMKDWRFPASRDGRDATVRLTLLFAR